MKIERSEFYALFGDFDTGLTVTELARYSRKMNGFQGELQTKHVEVNAFAAPAIRPTPTTRFPATAPRASTGCRAARSSRTPRR